MISVIIPIYNAAPYLPEMLQSLLEQTETYSNLKELSGVTINERIEYCQYFFPYMVFPLRCIRKIKTAIDT